ncbi:hypothetical protein [Acanthopleuribacter pedis]|uniref:Zinc-finger domain-containing protein n=1 Tax=Acanthopleuribacter pedis TaxID=442870 RepID=A0A8J7QI81_9BACT|nr:hypothetical protein [Acanthopleuribacter pedis]MBO1320795.1 hypothetical protein [Acanthopleuribacter pedis]
MKHLSEEQLIDILMNEPRDAALDQHLAECPPCNERYRLIADGLSVAEAAEPIIPEMPRPMISHAAFRRRTWLKRAVVLPLAAMLVLSLLGFGFQSDQDGFSVQFSLLGTQTTAANHDARIADLEQRLLEAIELNTKLTQNQMDSRFEAVFQERDQNLREFSTALNAQIKGIELQNSENMVDLREEMLQEVRTAANQGR